MHSLRRLVSCALLLSLFASVPACRKPAKIAVQQKGEAQQFVVETTAGKRLEFVAYGDVRFTNPRRTDASNPEIRRAIIAKLADEKPDFVLFTGDVVLAGDEEHDWDVYRSESQPL